MSRGYFGIGIVNGKKECNYGTLYRSAHCFDADFIFMIGKRFEKQASDTTKAFRHIPLYEYSDVSDFLLHRPREAMLVGVEINEKSRSIVNFIHPERAIYILGAEDSGLPAEIIEKCNYLIQIPSAICLNVAVAGSIVMYDRIQKAEKLEKMLEPLAIGI